MSFGGEGCSPLADGQPLLQVRLAEERPRTDGLQQAVFQPVARQRVANGRTGDDGEVRSPHPSPLTRGGGRVPEKWGRPAFFANR